MIRVPWALVGVGVVLAGGMAAGTLTDQPGPLAPQPAPTPRLSPVVRTVAVCPELLRSGDTVKTQLTAGASTPGAVVVRAAPLLPGGDLGPVVLSRGGIVGHFERPIRDSLAVAATAVGDRAGALEAEQVSRGDDGIQRGLAGIRCEPSQAETWFVGGSTVIGSETELVLVNAFDDTAQVSVTVVGPKGEVPGNALDGVVIGGRRRVVLRLSRVVPDLSVLAVHVVTLQGRVSAAMREARRNGLTPYGVDWVPRAGQPTTRVDLPGVPAGNGQRLLYLLAPGEDDATVSIRVSQSDLSYVPRDMDEIRVPAGRVRVLNLTKTIGGKPSSVQVFSDSVPVLAVGYAENHARYNPIREFAYMGAAQPLSGPTLVTDCRVGGPYRTTLLLSAPDGQARVRIRLIPVFGGEKAFLAAVRTVVIPAGRTMAVLLPGRAKPYAQVRPAVVEPLPGSGPVFAARELFEQGNRGPLITVLTLRTQPAKGVPVPAVRRDPLTPIG